MNSPQQQQTHTQHPSFGSPLKGTGISGEKADARAGAEGIQNEFENFQYQKVKTCTKETIMTQLKEILMAKAGMI